MIREAIQALVEGKSLSTEQAAQAMNEIMSGEATPAQSAPLSPPCASRERRLTRSQVWHR